MVGGGIAAGGVVVELALDIGEQAAGADAEAGGVEPSGAELLTHEDLPDEHLLGAADAAGGLEADDLAGALVEGADGAGHHQADGQGGVDGFLAGRGLDEIGAGHHTDEAGAGDVGEGAELAGGQDGFQVGVAAAFAEGGDLVIEGGPIAGQDVGARDDDVDFGGAGFDGFLDFQQAGAERGLTAGETGGDGGDGDIRATEGAAGIMDAAVVDADGGDARGLGEAEGGDQLGAQGLAGFGAEALDAAGGVAAFEGGEVDAGEGAQQPGGLPFALDGAAGGEGGSALFGGGSVDAGLAEPGEIEGDGGGAGGEWNFGREAWVNYSMGEGEGCDRMGRLDKGIVVMDEVKYPRLAERLKEPVPAGRIEWARELAMDLAVGFNEGAWGNRIYFRRTVDLLDVIDQSQNELLTQKWKEVDFSDGINLVKHGYLGDEGDFHYDLTVKATNLALAPTITPTVFISYKHGSCAPLAKLIAIQIASKTNAKPFLDEQREVSENRDEGFEKEIDRCVAMIVVLREDSLSPESYVRTEATLALNAGKQFASLWHDGYETEEEQQDVPPNDELKVKNGKFIAVPVEGESAGSYSLAIEKLLRELCNNNEYLSYEYKPDWLE